MGEVLTFSPRLKPTPVVSPTAHAPARPSANPSLWDIWSDPASWLLSAKGNPYIRIDGERDEYCVTIWRTKDGWWRWCIGRDSRNEPLWSPFEFDTEYEAREAAWKALEELEGMKQA
jgi:hypothetical protein